MIVAFSRLVSCVDVLWPSQPSGVMSSAVSLPNHTFAGQAKSSKRLASIVHVISLSFSGKRMCTRHKKKLQVAHLFERFRISMIRYWQLAHLFK